MPGDDIYQSINDLTPEAQQKIIDRLETRATDPNFVGMRERYLDRMNLANARHILDIGCGTGVVTRALAKRPELTGQIVGTDYSDVLINAAIAFAQDEGLADRISFQIEDSHASTLQDASFDTVLAHTLVSHVVDPSQVIAEAVRVLEPGGMLAIFDGDFASITFGAGSASANAQASDAIVATMVATPHVMRQMPAILADCGLELVDFLPDLLAEAGQARFFQGMIDAYLPMAITKGHMPESEGRRWMKEQQQASEAGRFFGACNFYTYLARKPS